MIGIIGKVEPVGGNGHGDPTRQLCDMRGETLDAHAFLVGLPVEVGGGYPFQHFAGGPGFLFELF